MEAKIKELFDAYLPESKCDDNERYEGSFAESYNMARSQLMHQLGVNFERWNERGR